jgi:hypothetical protein
MTELEAHSRWEHYFMRRGSDCSAFWKDYLSSFNRKVLFILGLGFDPRMCLGLRMLLEADPECVKECLLVRYNEGPNSPSLDYQNRVDANVTDVKFLLNSKGVIREVDVPMMSIDGRRIGSRRASEAISENVIDRFDDIVVDISSMPRGIYFPIITKLLNLLDVQTRNGASGASVNLHVLVAEQVSIDEKIQEEGIDDHAAYMHGFSSDLVQESTANAPRIWIPVLGEGKKEQLIRLYDHVRPDEICPVFPSPSVNPRRTDDLVREYRELLFDRLRVEPPNIIYASEWNPFEVYRQISRTIERYNSALDALGKCKVVVSALSSKLLSVGALLAAYEAKRKGFMIGISHVETHGYRIHGDIGSCEPELNSLWIAGECYNA